MLLSPVKVESVLQIDIDHHFCVHCGQLFEISTAVSYRDGNQQDTCDMCFQQGLRDDT